MPRSSRNDNHNRLGEDASKYLVVHPGDVVFNKLRTWQGGLGVSRHEGIVSPAYYVCRPGPSVEPRFLHYLLRSRPYLAELTRVSKFMPPSQFDILWDDLRAIPVLHPALTTQRAIADYLDTETARIDALIAKKTEQCAVVNERAVRVLNDFFGVEHELGRDGVPIGLPGHDMVRLGYLGRVQTGITLDAGRTVSPELRPVAYLRVANVQDGRLDLSEIKTVTIPASLEARCSLRPGDVLMTEGGDPDKLGRGTIWRGEVTPCVHQNHVFAVRCDASRLLPEYLAVVSRTSYARRYFEVTCSKTTGIASTSSSKIADFRVPLPALDQQRGIVERYTDYVRANGRVLAALEKQISLLREHRQALITAAVTGQLEIPGVAS